MEVRRTRAGPSRHSRVRVRTLQPAETFNDAIRKSVRVVERDGARIGYLRIWSFASRGVEEVHHGSAHLRAAEERRRAGARHARTWGGAPPDATDLFVGRSPTMTVTDRDGETEHRDDELAEAGGRNHRRRIAQRHGDPGAWPEAGGVPLVGTKTAGDVLAGRAFMLKDNSILELAVLDVHVDGMRLEGNGVTPDIEIPFDLRYADGADPQFDRAVDEMDRLLSSCGARPARLRARSPSG